MTDGLSELAKIAKEEEAQKKRQSALRQRKKRALDKLKNDIGSFALEQDKQHIKATKATPIDSLYAFNQRYQIVPNGSSDSVLESVSEEKETELSAPAPETIREEAEIGMVSIPREDYEYLKIMVAKQEQNDKGDWRLGYQDFQPFMNEVHTRVSEWE